MEFIIVNILFFSIIFLIGIYRNDYSIVDVAWGLSFIIIAMTGVFYQNNEITLRESILLIGIFLWALRLSGYILYRNLKLGREDFRYSEMRKGWGKKVKTNAYFKVYLGQAILSLVVASPLISIFMSNQNVMFGNIYDYTGISFMLIGFIIESIADYQKNLFKSDNNNIGKPCARGLWKYSRHPNYFGEACFWWGVGFLAFSEVIFYWAFLGPILLNFLLLKVSGVPLLEEKYKNNIHFKKYIQTTSPFILWKPKRDLE